MTKVAIKNENITSSGGIYHIIDVFSKLGFERQGWKATDRSGNDFRQARKCQTFREMTFAMRGNAKPFGKRLSPCAEMLNLLRNDLREPPQASKLLKSELREARKRQNLLKVICGRPASAKSFKK